MDKEILFARRACINQGHIELKVVKSSKKSVAKKVFYERNSRLSPAIYLDGITPCFYIYHIGGGLIENENYSLDVKIENSANALLTNQAPTYIYKCENDGYSAQNAKFNIDQHATLEFINDPIIPYEDSNFKQHYKFYLQKNSSLIYIESLNPCRKSNFEYKKIFLDSSFFIEDELIFVDKIIIEPKKENLKNIGFFEEFSHFGTLNFISPNITKNLKNELLSICKTENINLGVSRPHKNLLCVRILAKSSLNLNQILYQFHNYLRTKILNLPKISLRKY